MPKKKVRHVTGANLNLVSGTDSRTYSCFVMTNASAKRIGEHDLYISDAHLMELPANQNEGTVKILKLGMILPTIVSLVLRFLFRRNSLPPSIGSVALYVATFLPALFLYKYLVKIGTARRDPTTGTLISYGEDLSQQGVTEWCFDILYVTCGCYSCIIILSVDPSATGACQIGSGAFGEWFWWLYMIVSRWSLLVSFPV